MGRVSGDGGVFFLVTDIAVKPLHQGKGYGRKLMEEITEYLRREVPAGSFATLIADKPADRLYAQFGFQPVSPGQKGCTGDSRAGCKLERLESNFPEPII